MLHKYTNHGDLLSSASHEGMEMDWVPVQSEEPVWLYGSQDIYQNDVQVHMGEHLENRGVFTQDVFGAPAIQGTSFVDKDERMSPPPSSPSYHQDAPPMSYPSIRPPLTHHTNPTSPSPDCSHRDTNHMALNSFEDLPDGDIAPPSSQDPRIAPRANYVALDSFADLPDDDIAPPNNDITPPGSQEMQIIVPCGRHVQSPRQDMQEPLPPMYIDGDDDINPPSDDLPTYIDNDNNIPPPSQEALVASPTHYIDSDDDIPPPSQEAPTFSPPSYINKDDNIPPPSQEALTFLPPTYINDDDDISPPSQEAIILSPSIHINNNDILTSH
ncbi:hypothetical protein JAAARDRAFT_189952 [Jaapia argillacea MUCL 33604]|uniref:Uncharacterized protein n=1 Tax=Jaapia argillacea MUCL 33604 TaxID=933084 RepID=A0A067Q6Q9_9AGAM|nr:hypothetical protein JAAARDRAFT_189952 [Jaapia argillacea MUCL 33604]